MRCSSARRLARSCATAAICRVMLPGDDVSRVNDNGGVGDLGESGKLEVGDGLLGGLNDADEERRR
jgi:hypothetical protein